MVKGVLALLLSASIYSSFETDPLPFLFDVMPQTLAGNDDDQDADHPHFCHTPSVQHASGSGTHMKA